MFKIKYILSFVIIITIAFLVSSCHDDLENLPEGSNINSADVVFGAELDQYTRFLSKLYGGLAVSGPNGAGSTDIQGIDAGFGQYIRAYYMMQEVPTDEAVLGWTGDAGVIDMGAATFSAENPFINAMYQRVMYQIAVCNEFLRQTTPDLLSSRGVSSSDQSIIQQYRNEARFLRVLSYWHGLDIFGKMSFVIESDPVDPSFLPPEVDPTTLFNFIESELLAIESSMTAAGQAEYGRADQAAAWMVLAKLYLNSSVYTGTDRSGDALTYSERVITQSGKNVNMPYNFLFLADNNSNGAENEIIFAVPSDGVNLQSFGSTTFIIHAAVGADMNPGDFGVDGGWFGLRTRSQFVSLFDNTDSRGMFATTGRNVIVESMATNTDGYGIEKFKNVTSSGNAGSNLTFVDTDFPMFRLADAYLMYAEAHLRGGGGNITNAVDYINELRQRVGANQITSTDLTLDFILDERGRELYWECHRRQDLIRFGRFTGGDYIWDWKGNTQAGTSLPATASVMPIPQDVLTANTNLTQNEGY